MREATGYWALPGGGLEFGETTPEGIKREIREEMGLEVSRVAEEPSHFIVERMVVDPNIYLANVIYETEV